MTTFDCYETTLFKTTCFCLSVVFPSGLQSGYVQIGILKSTVEQYSNDMMMKMRKLWKSSVLLGKQSPCFLYAISERKKISKPQLNKSKVQCKMKSFVLNLHTDVETPLLRLICCNLMVFFLKCTATHLVNVTSEFPTKGAWNCPYHCKDLLRETCQKKPGFDEKQWGSK